MGRKSGGSFSWLSSAASRIPLALVVTLVLGAVIAVSVTLTSRSEATVRPTTRTTLITPTTPETPVKASVAPAVIKAQQAAPRPVGVLVASSRVASLPIFAAPGRNSPAQTLPNPNNLGAPLVLLVNAVKGRWVQMFLPERPNESLGWTLASDVTLSRNPESILVNLTSRHLELLRGSSVLFQASVAVGSPVSPTPTGHFYVTEVLRVVGDDSPYGPYALGLSGFSNTYQTFDGGPAQIAIHGTDEPWAVGQYASHGCVRLQNSQITELASRVEAGTPVDIVA